MKTHYLDQVDLKTKLQFSPARFADALQRKLYLRICESVLTAAGYAAKILQQNPVTAVCFVPMVQSGVPVDKTCSRHNQAKTIF